MSLPTTGLTHTTSRGMRLVGLIVLTVLAATPECVAGQEYSRPADPFRGDDEILGREFEYNALSFLHRFSYSFRPETVRRWNGNPQGYRGTGGSVTSEEFYVVQEFAKTFRVDGPFLFDFQYRRAEDFDGTYDRVLLGGGVELGKGWSTLLRGDVVQSKEEVDLHVETRWESVGGSRARFGVVVVDWFFNTKAPDSRRYSTRPFTYFASGLWVGPKGQVEGWLNYNAPLRQERPLEGFDFTYDQLSGGFSATQSLSDAWSVHAFARGERGTRGYRGSEPGFIREGDFDREATDARVEVMHTPNATFRTWVGVRYFRLSEKDTRPNAAESEQDLLRRESMMYGGVGWRLGDRFLLWPTLYLQNLDNESSAPPVRNPDKKADRVRREDRIPARYGTRSERVDDERQFRVAAPPDGLRRVQRPVVAAARLTVRERGPGDPPTYCSTSST